MEWWLLYIAVVVGATTAIYDELLEELREERKIYGIYKEFEFFLAILIIMFFTLPVYLMTYRK